jgi:tRNA(Ile)-lysidine synthase
MRRVKEYMEQYHMIDRGDRVVAGISGGADSVCLFFVLLELQGEMGFEFVAVHVNHGLRGESANRDERFVKELCAKYGVPLEISHIDLESTAKKWKQSLEEAGRQARRRAYEDACRKYGCNKIALAHHQNDNAETLLLNLSRGSGLAGMGGIRPVNGAYLHPLLCLTRQEAEQYLRDRGQEWCTDETNLETEYTRNKLRHLGDSGSGGAGEYTGGPAYERNNGTAPRGAGISQRAGGCGICAGGLSG